MAALCMSACTEKQTLTLSGLDPQAFVGEKDGKATALYTLTNANGMEVCVTNFGGRIVSVMVPDKDGNMVDVVLGFDNIHDYMTQSSYFGALDRAVVVTPNGIEQHVAACGKRHFTNLFCGCKLGFLYRAFKRRDPTGGLDDYVVPRLIFQHR